MARATKHPIEELADDPRNPRRISDEGLAGLDTSVHDFGDLSGIVFNQATGHLVTGHQRMKTLRAAGAKDWTHNADGATGFIVDPRTGERFGIRIVEWDDVKERLANLTANNAAIQGEWTSEAANQLEALKNEEQFASLRLAELAEEVARIEVAAHTRSGKSDPDDVPDPPKAPITKRGDLWILGNHRILCGDSTNLDDVARLTDDLMVTCIHADPPYGMGKEADGIENDNIYGDKLAVFQMAWWNAWAPALKANGSAYIWGNAPELWRLWWRGGLAEWQSRDLLVRNEIVWDKGSGFGMASDGAHSYPPATERCLFLMRGQQFLGNQNKDDYWDGYEPLRSWLEAERDKAGMTNGDVNRLTKTNMAGHWFSKSQFAPISCAHYETIARAAAGVAFTENYNDLFERLFPSAKAGGNAHRRELAARLRESRSYFDNAHDVMTDVWRFPRVLGEERFGHATPKPVAMVARAIKSSSNEGDIIGAPFSGTGPEIVAAEQLGRCCRAMELSEAYVDIAISRWEAFTGERAVLAPR